MAFSASSFTAATCSVVLLPAWYAHWSKGIYLLNLYQYLSIKQMARIFLSTDSKMIGLRFSGGPLVFPGFCNGIRMPCLISFGKVPVSAMLFIMLAISWCNSSGAYFTCSAYIWSMPQLLLFFSLFAALVTSSCVNGVLRGIALMGSVGLLSADLKVSSKNFVIILLFLFSRF